MSETITSRMQEAKDKTIIREITGLLINKAIVPQMGTRLNSDSITDRMVKEGR